MLNEMSLACGVYWLLLYIPVKPITSNTRTSKSFAIHRGGLLKVRQDSVFPNRRSSSRQIPWPCLKIDSSIQFIAHVINCEGCSCYHGWLMLFLPSSNADHVGICVHEKFISTSSTSCVVLWWVFFVLCFSIGIISTRLNSYPWVTDSFRPEGEKESFTCAKVSLPLSTLIFLISCCPHCRAISSEDLHHVKHIHIHLITCILC